MFKALSTTDNSEGNAAIATGTLTDRWETTE